LDSSRITKHSDLVVQLIDLLGVFCCCKGRHYRRSVLYAFLLYSRVVTDLEIAHYRYSVWPLYSRNLVPNVSVRREAHERFITGSSRYEVGDEICDHVAIE
jgi:hypothetical protein